MALSTIRVTTATGTVELNPDRSHVIGRSREADVTIQDTKVSRRHVELAPGPDGWVARDLSTNGMWSEGARARQLSVDGEVRIRLGGLTGPEILLRAIRPAPRPAPAPPRPGPENADAETVLAGQGRRPEPTRPAPPARVPEPVGAPTWVGWLSALPTLVWLAAVGFALGALIALS